MAEYLILYYTNASIENIKKNEDCVLQYNEKYDDIIKNEIREYRLDRFTIDENLLEYDAILLKIPQHITISKESVFIMKILENKKEIMIVTDYNHRHVEYVIRDMVSSSIYVLINSNFMINIFNLILESKQLKKISRINIIEYDDNIK
jgi:hypothetical protein